jgi:hypothetical protein
MRASRTRSSSVESWAHSSDAENRVLAYFRRWWPVLNLEVARFKCAITSRWLRPS